MDPTKLDPPRAPLQPPWGPDETVALHGSASGSACGLQFTVLVPWSCFPSSPPTTHHQPPPAHRHQGSQEIGVTPHLPSTPISSSWEMALSTTSRPRGKQALDLGPPGLVVAALGVEEDELIARRRQAGQQAAGLPPTAQSRGEPGPAQSWSPPWSVCPRPARWW